MTLRELLLTCDAGLLDADMNTLVMVALIVERQDGDVLPVTFSTEERQTHDLYNICRHIISYYDDYLPRKFIPVEPE